MVNESQTPPASPVEMEARFNALRVQRDQAMDQLVMCAGRIAELEDKLAQAMKLGMESNK